MAAPNVAQSVSTNSTTPKKKQQLTLSEAIARIQKYGHSSASQKQIDKYVFQI